MTSGFSTKVTTIVGPVLSRLGFVLEAVDDDVDEGGRQGSVVYFSSVDCRIQLYWSPRGGEINCMIAPMNAPNVPGLYDTSGKWRFWNEFVERPSVPLEELVELLRSEKVNFETDESWLRWWAERIQRFYSAAHAGILKATE